MRVLVAILLLAIVCQVVSAGPGAKIKDMCTGCFKGHGVQELLESNDSIVIDESVTGKNKASPKEKSIKDRLRNRVKKQEFLEKGK